MKQNEERQILKVLVGSHAHGLATPESDYDYRGVYATPTSQLLSLFAGKQKGTHWVEGENEDATSYELGHFLSLATHCNPSILEVFMAPVAGQFTTLGTELRQLFPSVWNARDVANAFTGYSLNQRKKFLEDKDGRKWKFAVAYIRVLLQAIELLTVGTFSLKVPDENIVWAHSVAQPWSEYLRAVKRGAARSGDVIDTAESLKDTVFMLAKDGPHSDHEPDLEKVDEFLLKVRRDNW